MRRNELDYILSAMLDSQKEVSDLLFTVDRPLQVESDGVLVPGHHATAAERPLTPVPDGDGGPQPDRRQSAG